MSYEQLSPETVYILGAGFSREADVPLQTEILESIRDLSLSDAPDALVNPFLNARNLATEFLLKVFGQNENLSLEDLFTLLDEGITQKQYCMGYSWRELDQINKALNEVILFLFHIKQNSISKEGQQFYNTIAAYLIRQRLKSAKEHLPFSVISLNWDCVLENAIYWCLNKCNCNIVDVDYSCYSTPIPESPRFDLQKSQNFKGIYNIKFMKLHGSTNWLLCPNCNRLFSGLGASEEIWTQYILSSSCPRCDYVFSTMNIDNLNPPILEPFLITPTFIKKFENPHIKMIWHNAYIDLCEAQNVVFIGYSLPEADYHLRTLLKRAIRPDANIEVVLAPGDKPPQRKTRKRKEKTTFVRYGDFFGTSTQLSFNFEGVKKYFSNYANPNKLNNQLRSIQRLHKRRLKS